jgi:hypothetical protein
MNNKIWYKILDSKIYRFFEEGNIKKVKRYFNKIYENKKFVGIILIISIIIGIVIYNLSNEYSATSSTILEYNYKGIEKGLDPTGRNLDISIVESDEILGKVIKDLKLEKYNLNVSLLNKNIDIIPIVPSNIVEQIKTLESEKNLNIDETYENVYYPSKYKIVLNMPDSFNVDDNNTRNILNKVIENYEEYFYNKYSDKDTLENVIGELQYKNYDYPEISTVISNQIFLINNFLSNKLNTEEGENFRSEKTGMSFNDIVESVNILKNVDVDRMDSIIGAYNLTKDKQKLIKLYEYRIQQLELQNNKKNDESDLTADIMNKYKKEKSILILPGMGVAGNAGEAVGEIEMTKDDEYYDSLAQRGTSAGIESKYAIHDAKYYEDQIEKLENDNISIEVKQKAEKELVVLIDDIKSKLEDRIKISNDTMTEYYDENYLSSALKTYDSTSSSFIDKKLVLYVNMSIIIGIIFSLVSLTIKIYIIDEFKFVKSKHKNKKAYI